MMNDQIVEEIHQIRADLLQQYHGDFAAYFAALMQKQQQHPERYVTFMDAARTGQAASLKSTGSEKR